MTWKERLCSNLLLRNLASDVIGYPVSAEQKTFIPYFQYKTGVYQRDYYLYFTAQPNSVQYTNNIFNKLYEYNGYDIIQYVEFHYNASDNKADCRKMELKYQLKQVLSPKRYLSQQQRNIPRHDQRKERLQQDIQQVLSKSGNYQQFEQWIKEKGYAITKGRGISFTDEKKVKVKGSEIGYSLQKIEKILDLQQHLQQVKEDKAKQEQSQRLQPAKMLLQYTQAMQEAEHLRDKESLLTKTIGILLNPTANDNYLPQELLKQHQQQKKKLQQRRSYHL